MEIVDVDVYILYHIYGSTIIEFEYPEFKEKLITLVSLIEG